MELLPALPAAWPRGSIRGLRARGGYVIDMAWENGRLRSASIFSRNGGTAQLRYGDQVVPMHFERGESRKLAAESFAKPHAGAAAAPRRSEPA
ncbi:MAG: glycoside hydrolase family 95-like protein [Acidobacteriaceae bacterium]